MAKWIPELRQIHDPYGSVDSITIRMLLSHSSGFQNPTWPWTEGKSWEPFEPTTWNQLVAMMPYEEVHFKPGTKYSYSNPGFIYLARIVELITGDPFETYLQKNVWTPLGLTHSYFGATPYWLAADRSNNYTVERDSGGHISRITDWAGSSIPASQFPTAGGMRPSPISGGIAPFSLARRRATPRSAACTTRYCRGRRWPRNVAAALSDGS